MGHYDDCREAEEEERWAKWDKESEELIIKYGYGTLREELEVLCSNLEHTQQLSFVFEQLNRLRQKLKLNTMKRR